MAPVHAGALYRELRGMEGEGLVAAVRTEQVGRRPARTVYEITGEAGWNWPCRGNELSPRCTTGRIR